MPRSKHTTASAECRQQQRLGEELRPNVVAGRTERAPQPDLRTPLQHRDDHRVSHPDPADEQRYGAQTKEQAGEGGVGGPLRGERLGKARHPHLPRMAGAGRKNKQARRSHYKRRNHPEP
nr:hypothetical protein [Glycomyces buryatensis]